ncbi:uncharacterized protein [Palaemon carinicauda]|uniref:uncharacterized protein n=1 Tax=Palaemon carinicauda TaxID=392227 RepID=UPI0035B60668
MEAFTPKPSFGGMRASRSVDFQKIRNSFRRKPKAKTTNGAKPSESNRDLAVLSTDRNAPSPVAETIRSSSWTDISTAEKVTHFPSGVAVSVSKESLKNRILGRMKIFHSSKDELYVKVPATKPVAADKGQDGNWNRDSLIVRMKGKPSTKEGSSSKSVEPGNDPSSWKGVRLLNKFYSHEQSLDNIEGAVSKDGLSRNNAEESYRKDVNYVEKAQNASPSDNFGEETDQNNTDNLLVTAEDNQKQSEDSEDDIDKEMDVITTVAKDQGNWLDHDRPAPVAKLATDKSNNKSKGNSQVPPSRRDNWRVRSSAVSLNGSLRSLSTIPIAPTPRPGQVLRNSRYTTQKRGKVARQSFQVYPKSFSLVKEKLGRKFSRRNKISSESSSPYSIECETPPFDVTDETKDQ